jgi:hypothetical protein
VQRRDERRPSRTRGRPEARCQRDGEHESRTWNRRIARASSTTVSSVRARRSGRSGSSAFTARRALAIVVA